MTPADAIATAVYVCLVLSCASVSLRILVRWKWLEAGLRLDDWLMMLALGSYAVFCAFILAFTMLENRNPVLTEPTANRLLLLLSIAEVFFMVTSIALKTSLMIFFRQFILERKQRLFLTYTTGFYCVMSMLGMFLAFFPCGAPVNLARKRTTGKCMPIALWNGLLYAHGAISVLSDWIFALLPILVLWKSSMPAKTKFGVTLLIVFAVCGSLCAVLRTIYTGSLDFDASYYDPQHPSYYHATALLINMAVMEMGIGITAASVACLMPLFRRCAGASRRCLAASSRRFNLEGRNPKDSCGGSTTWVATNASSSAPWNNNLVVRPDVKSFKSGTIELRSLGILPTVDPTTGEDICGESLNDHCYSLSLI